MSPSIVYMYPNGDLLAIHDWIGMIKLALNVFAFSILLPIEYYTAFALPI